jgi:hypothetical protein
LLDPFAPCHAWMQQQTTVIKFHLRQTAYSHYWCTLFTAVIMPHSFCPASNHAC